MKGAFYHYSDPGDLEGFINNINEEEQKGQQLTYKFYNIPEFVTVITFFGRPADVPSFSTSQTKSMPSTTFPNTTCLPSNHAVGTVVIKNYEQGVVSDNDKIVKHQQLTCDPFVLGPAFAIDRRPGRSCFSLKFSSVTDICNVREEKAPRRPQISPANLSPYMDLPPVPLCRVKSPPCNMNYSQKGKF